MMNYFVHELLCNFMPASIYAQPAEGNGAKQRHR